MKTKIKDLEYGDVVLIIKGKNKGQIGIYDDEDGPRSVVLIMTRSLRMGSLSIARNRVVEIENACEILAEIKPNKSK